MATEARERIQFDSMVPWTGTFLNLDKPRTITQSPREVPKFSGNFEIEKGSPEDKRIRAAIVEAARQLWPNMDVGAAIREGRINVPISDGDKLADKAKQKSDDTGKSAPARVVARQGRADRPLQGRVPAGRHHP
jgi:hypothetical protein